MDYESMTVQELEDVLLELKLKKLAITEQQRVIQAVRRDKLDIVYLAQRLNIDATGIDAEAARSLLAMVRDVARPGDVVVTPEPAELQAEPAAGEVEL